MALGDGITWDETLPSDATNAVQIDDYNRDLRKGVRNRMALEHEWPGSQSATSEAGQHKFITMQEQGTKPTVSGTQKSALYTDTNNNLIFEKSDGALVTIVNTTAVGDGKVLANSTDATQDYLDGKLGAGLVNSGTNIVVSAVLGTWNAGAFGSTQTAATDLVVIAYVSGTAAATLQCETPAGTIRGLEKVLGITGGAVAAAISMPVKSGNTWLVTKSGEASSAISFIPIGA